MESKSLGNKQEILSFIADKFWGKKGCKLVVAPHPYNIQRERGQWAVYYTSPQSFIVMFSYSLGTFTKL